MSGVFGVAAFVAFMVFGVTQIVAGFVGIEHELGSGWAYGALVAAFLLRFTLPITIGSFFGAMNVWGWHWALAAIFAAPGLALIIPGALASIFSVIKKP